MNVDGKKIKIIGIKEVKLDLPIEVYNLNVRPLETYFANGILVHNKAAEAKNDIKDFLKQKLGLCGENLEEMAFYIEQEANYSNKIPKKRIDR